MSAAGILGWRMEWQGEPRPRARALWLVVAMAGAFFASALLFLSAGASPIEAFGALLKGAFGSRRAIAETLVKATPLILTGLAAAIAFRARIWNIGAEGQVVAGAMMAYWVQSHLAELSGLVQIPMLLIAAALGGALYAGLAAVLKTALRVDEVISTVMLNYIIFFALSLLLLQGPWSEAGSYYEQTAKVDETARLPVLLDRTKLHLGFPLAVALAILAYVMIRKSPIGYEIRAAGSNLRALEVQGTSATRIVIVTMLISGAFAGLAGATEVYGVDHRLKGSILVTLGYTGIIVAMLGRLSPLGVVLAAVLFGALLQGATAMQIKTGVPTTLIYAIQAIILLFYLAGWAAGSLRIRRADAG
jgi:general nucleoside transport system permease protein